MEFTFDIAIAFLATFLCGVMIGCKMGLERGISLGMRYLSGRPLSPLPWILCLIGAGLFFIGAISTSIYSVSFLARSVTTKATITDVYETKDEEGSVARFPCYSFVDAAGNSYGGRSRMSYESFEIGDTLIVRYLENTPEKSRIDSFGHHWFLPLFLGVMSIILGAFGLFLRWWKSREQRWADHVIAENKERWNPS